MRTSLNKIQIAEDYLYGTLSNGDALLFEANMIVDENLRTNVDMQKETYSLVQQYSRKQLKAEIEAASYKLFHNQTHIGFVKKILRLFN